MSSDRHRRQTRPTRQAEMSKNDTERRDEHFPRLFRRRRDHPTYLEKNPTCSRRVLLRAKLTPIPINWTELN